MKKLLSLLATTIMLILVSMSSVHAQNGAFAPYVDAGISGTNSTGVVGLSNPNYRVGGGIESSTDHLLLDINGQFDFANLTGIKNIATNNGGYTGTLTGSAYLKLDRFLVGGGALYSNQIASGSVIGFAGSINRDQVRPFVGAGYQCSRDRILVNYVLPGKDQVGAGHYSFGNLADKTVQVRNEIFLGKGGLTKHLRFTQNFDVSNNKVAGLGTAATTYTVGVGLKFVL